MKRLALAAALAWLTLGCNRQASNDFTHVVQVNRNVTTGGDSIRIQEVRGPSENWVAGATYEVSGSYKLTSHDKALLGAFVAAPARNSGPAGSEQVTEVARGEGQFRLRFRLPETLGGCRVGTVCGPHLSLYPLAGGDSFLSAYI